MVTPDLPTVVNNTLGYPTKFLTLARCQHQLWHRMKERKLIVEETTCHNHQIILVEILTQMMMTIMKTTNMKVIAGAGEADVRNPRVEDHLLPEMLLPVLGQC